MRRSTLLRIGAAVLGAALAAAPAAAATSFDFLFSVNHVSDDSQYFLNLAVSSYGYSRPVLEPVLPRLAYVEADLPVVLFLADRSGRRLDFIVGLRAQDLGWAVVFDRCGVPPDVLFDGIDRDPGPPYGKAWGHWRKQPRAVRLSDSEIVGLVNVQIGHRIAGVPTYDLARGTGGGRPVVVAVADKRGREYEEGHPSDRGNGGGKSGKPGKGNGKDKGNGKGH